MLLKSSRIDAQDLVTYASLSPYWLTILVKWSPTVESIKGGLISA